MALAIMWTFLVSPTGCLFWPESNLPPVSPDKDRIVEVSVILPEKYNIEGGLEADMRKAGSGVLVGLTEAAEKGLLPEGFYFNVSFFDSRCDQSYAPKAFIDAKMGGSHVLFGPSCEYSLGELLLRQGGAHCTVYTQKEGFLVSFIRLHPAAKERARESVN